MKSRTAWTQTIPVRSALGLNILAASLLARTASRFASDITVQCHGVHADAKRALSLLTLAAVAGSILVVRAQGRDAAEAMRAILRLFRFTPPLTRSANRALAGPLPPESVHKQRWKPQCGTVHGT